MTAIAPLTTQHPTFIERYNDGVRKVGQNTFAWVDKLAIKQGQSCYATVAKVVAAMLCSPVLFCSWLGIALWRWVAGTRLPTQTSVQQTTTVAAAALPAPPQSAPVSSVAPAAPPASPSAPDENERDVAVVEAIGAFDPENSSPDAAIEAAGNLIRLGAAPDCSDVMQEQLTQARDRACAWTKERLKGQLRAGKTRGVTHNQWRTLVTHLLRLQTGSNASYTRMGVLLLTYALPQADRGRDDVQAVLARVQREMANDLDPRAPVYLRLAQEVDAEENRPLAPAVAASA